MVLVGRVGTRSGARTPDGRGWAARVAVPAVTGSTTDSGRERDRRRLVWREGRRSLDWRQSPRAIASHGRGGVDPATRGPPPASRFQKKTGSVARKGRESTTACLAGSAHAHRCRFRTWPPRPTQFLVRGAPLGQFMSDAPPVRDRNAAPRAWPRVLPPPRSPPRAPHRDRARCGIAARLDVPRGGRSSGPRHAGRAHRVAAIGLLLLLRYPLGGRPWRRRLGRRSGAGRGSPVGVVDSVRRPVDARRGGRARRARCGRPRGAPVDGCRPCVCARGATMGNAFSWLLASLFGDKEARILILGLDVRGGVGGVCCRCQWRWCARVWCCEAAWLLSATPPPREPFCSPALPVLVAFA